jgi:mycothiol synthase
VGSAVLRAPEPSEMDTLQAIWDASHRQDDPASWPKGGWSVSGWADSTRVLVVQDAPVGVAAVRAETAPDGAMPARVALALDARTEELARALVDGALAMIADAGGTLARLWVPGRAGWLQPAAAEVGFTRVRTVAHMLLGASVPTPVGRAPDGWRIRVIRDGEDADVLAALNRAWVGTWNFVAITREMLDADLKGQREGMLLGVADVDGVEQIIATCHAVFDATDSNPDGAPRAWISNLTVAPEFRGRGVSRTMLAEGIARLRQRGATSVTLGVDADNPAPFTLYQSVGFEIDSSVEAWDATVQGK